ncbi:MAG: alpha/beta hydrolase [Bradyrhizobium sp.]
MRLLGAAQEGGSAVAECCVTAGRIDVSDDNSWYGEWKRLADANHERGNKAFSKGYVLTARGNWLRAINYYQSAALPFDWTDEKYRVAVESMRRCAREYVGHGSPRGEVVSIPWPSGYPLEGYFLPAPDSSRRAPAVICIGEPGQRKEEYLYKVARYARERGIALLAVDLFGAGPDTRFDEVVGRSDLEMTIGCIMDYLVDRDDVDEGRIAIVADGWGSSFVARGIAFDDRFAAAVCDGGLWDLVERTFLRDRLAFPAGGIVGDMGLSRVARNLKCPVLISTGERGWLKAERVRELCDGLKADGRDVTLKIFTSEETAAMQGHADNPTLANEFIFDWIVSRLGMPAQ